MIFNRAALLFASFFDFVVIQDDSGLNSPQNFKLTFNWQNLNDLIFYPCEFQK